jgi:glutamine cyclotransferase
MIKKYFLPFLGLVLILNSCSDAADKIAGTHLKVSTEKNKVLMNESFTVQINEAEGSIDSLYFPNAKPIRKNGLISAEFNFDKPGSKRIEVIGMNTADNSKKRAFVTVNVVSGVTPVKLNYEILKEIDHNPESYTQGLELDGNILYESTGLNGKSKVIKFDYPSFNIQNEISLDQKYFGEGLTIVGDSIYQLTWRENVCFIYNKDLEKIGELPVPTAEGWGLTHGNGSLFLTDGTGNLYTTDNKLSVKEISPVYFGERAINSLNELEFVDGKIWANVYGADQIVRINSKTGVIDAFVDFTQLKLRQGNKNADVLNGIAYIPEDDTYLITGKNWDKMFLMKFSE